MIKKILIAMLSIVVLTGCGSSAKENSEKQDTVESQEQDFGFTVILDSRSIKIGDTIENINLYIGDDYTETITDIIIFKNNDIEIETDKNNTVISVSLYTDRYKVEGESKISENIDYVKTNYNNLKSKTLGDDVIFYNKTHTVSISFNLENNIVKKIHISKI